MYKYIKPLVGSIILVAIASMIHVTSALIVPTLTALIINNGVLQGNMDVIGSLSTQMLGASLVTVIGALFAVYMSSHIASRISFALRADLVQALQAYSLSDYSKFGTGTLLMRTTRDVEKIQSVLAEGINLILPMPIMILGGLGLTFYKSTELGFVILVIMIIMVTIMALIQKKALPIVRRVQLQIDSITDLVRDHMLGMSVIRAFNRSTDENNREISAFTHMAGENTRLARTYAIGLPSILIIFNLSTVIILWAGGYNVSAGTLQIGDIMAIIEYATLILLNLLMAVFVLLDVPEALICYHRIQEILQYNPTNPSVKGALLRTNGATLGANGNLLGTNGNLLSTNENLLGVNKASHPTEGGLAERPVILSFKDVTFRYDHAEEPALNEVSFNLHEGEHLAIMGDIGSGKSTIAKLILGLFPIESGRIELFGQNLFEQDLIALREYIGYVPQKAYLFTGSIAENISYGARKDQEITLAHIDKACTLAGAKEFIMKLPDTYEHQLSQGGTNISGGQRQRLAMARALLRSPKILIFDDSFSALDGTTEQQVRQAIDEELAKHKERAFISIEQKVSAARKADAILLINQGQAVGYGTHEELVETCHIYRQIVASQEVAL
ncbi:ABC transporter ATP-binding protein [uncultured Veillonella sp.]|uniref:ABC transporter ATP-binding protein n=1 Tax=uncultured Veillonella sp. TaxID=159268 RepID=UPI00261EB57C|nr:ABC transporter ATP-binding protein [uncultured Veillonella sp.]